MMAIDRWPTLSTERLILRPLQAGDASVMSRLVSTIPASPA